MRQRRIIVWGLLGAGLLAGAASGWHWARERQRARIVRAALPPIPDLSSWPSDYAVRVRVATAAANGRGQPEAALRELALLYHANVRYREAAEAERGLLTLEPRDGRWAYLLADACEKLGDTDGQRTFLERTLRQAPYYAAARIHLADLLLKLGFPDRARAQYERYLAMVPGEPHARLGLARLELDGGDREAGVAALAALLRDHPNFVAARNLLSEVYASEGDRKRATEERRLSGATGEGQEIDDPWLRWMYAWSFDPYRIELAGGADAQRRVIETTLPFYEAAARLAPGDGGACDALGGVDLQLNRLNAAAAVLEGGIARMPGSAELYDTLARTLRRQGRLPEALETLRRGRLAAPSAPVLPYDQGSLLEAQGHREAAVAAYGEALRLDPDFAAAHWRLGLCLLAMGRTADAQRSLGRALDLQPRRADALFARAQDALIAKQLDQAACCLGALIEHSPGMPVRQLVERGLALARQTGDAPAGRDFARMLAQPLP
jgi:tetratricopeptide (TPR) repeat protein